ncbi:MAG: hypothetical protein GY712_02800 [Oceanicoccus sp.]|uniref:hypothetical protein n=1 Tax=Oceanicoccus sp. TaxID=2691044 RepID=UPI00260553CA|nr:hypothetical protein [Oceanicoccus sp.]MCP3906925.1 hypothetical protein [Oceanicoccus sp.]MDG1773556.1 hypothetical protein [Oceanicoccus sp.]
MASAEQLEALINLESNLKAQYEKKITAERYKTEEQLEAKAKLQATIAQQAAEINQLKSGGTDIKRLEQENRELTNRSENIKNEFDALRAKNKAAQKELGNLKSEVKDLKQLDAKKLKKNLVETKKKLEEQRKANELLSKSNKEYKQESYEHQNTIAKLEAELEALKPAEEVEEKELAEA